MSDVPAKAVSVDKSGAPDGFEPNDFWRAEVLEGGHSRLTVSVGADRLAMAHRALLGVMEAPFKLRYLQLTDRHVGQLPKPRSLVGVEISAERLVEALDAAEQLVYQDGRHQIWIQDLQGAQVVLEEIGMLYIYPDDPSFRAALDAAGIGEGVGQSLAERDYICVRFDAACDDQEAALISGLSLVPWDG
jgi:hypothetical protein